LKHLRLKKNNVKPDLDLNLGPWEYRTAALLTKLSGRLHIIPWHNHFRNNLGIEHNTNLSLPEEFFNIIFTPSYYYVYLLAIIVLEFYSLHPLSGDNLVICYLSLWEVCRNLYDKIFKIEHDLSFITSRLKVSEFQKK
jgi:hypothetical protein